MGNKASHTLLTSRKAITLAIALIMANALLINLAFLISFSARYGLPFPEYNFLPYKKSFIFLTLIYTVTLFCFKVYKTRFKSSWDLFKRIFSGLFLGTLLSIAFVYVFRANWGAFPTSIFIISFFINLVLIFTFSRRVLKRCKRIRKKIVVIGRGEINDTVGKGADIYRIETDHIGKLIEYPDIDEIIICEKIQDRNNLNFLIYFLQKLKIDVVFSPSIYMELLHERINGQNSIRFLQTFVGGKKDVEEFLISTLDIIGSLVILFVSAPIIILVSLLIKIASPGSILYKQQRVGKDGEIFTLYKFRTMVKDAEKTVGPVLASRNDTRVTKVGRILRTARLDELPQLFNVLRGDMSLVGPRPERPHFVKLHKSLGELRLTVKPGLTGLAQIRNFYDLKPRHKVKYDYLYIQRRSLLLNFYILARTVPIIFSKKGW